VRKDAALSSAFRGITFQLGIRCLNRPLSIQEQVVQLVGIAASGHGFMLTNDPLHDEVGQRLVQRLHPVVSATERHMAGQLGGPLLPDDVPGSAICSHNSERGHLATTYARQQHLRDDCLNRIR